MLSFKSFRATIKVLALLSGLLSAQAYAEPMVTYTWTTTSQGFGPHVDQPSLATFEVALSVVQTGKISQFDITNIQLAYPGISFGNFTTSSGGNDFASFVDPVTGAPVYHDGDQGLAIFAYNNTIFDYTSFLSITFGGLKTPQSTTVADQYNAMNNNTPYAGYPTAGFWTASFPTVVDPGNTVPEPASLALIGMGMLGFAAIRRRKQ